MSLFSEPLRIFIFILEQCRESMPPIKRKETFYFKSLKLKIRQNLVFIALINRLRKMPFSKSGFVGRKAKRDKGAE
jgi:hypothetical protein